MSTDKVPTMTPKNWLEFQKLQRIKVGYMAAINVNNQMAKQHASVRRCVDLVNRQIRAEIKICQSHIDKLMHWVVQESP